MQDNFLDGAATERTMLSLIKDYAPIAISTFALLVSALSYSIMRRNERRNIKGVEPLFTAHVSAVKGQLGWFSIHFSIENRADHGYRLNRVEIKRPLFSRGLSHQQALSSKSPEKPWLGSDLINPLPLDEARRTIPMGYKIAKADVSSSGPFPGATHWGTILVHVRPRMLSSSLSIRFSLLSIDAQERESFFTIRRTLPAASSTTTD
jgi:hypothetical protein